MRSQLHIAGCQWRFCSPARHASYQISPDKEAVPPEGLPHVPADALLEAVIAEVLVEDTFPLAIDLKGWKSVSIGESYTVGTHIAGG